MLIITGSIAYDYIMDFPGSFGDHILPDQIHKINLSFIVSRFEKRRGGTAGNASYTLGLLDTPNRLFSTAGNDFGDYMQGFLKRGISVEGVLIDRKNYTATGFAMTDKNDNQIWGFFYGAADNNVNLQLKKVAKKGDFVLVGPSGSRATMSMIHQCVEVGLPYMFDPGFVLTQISNEDLAFGVKFCQDLIGNDYEINLIKERLPNWQEMFATKTVITTLGEKGATIQKQGKTYTIPVVKPEKVADPTGAGDAWRAGFLAGMLRGFDLQTAGQMGSLASAYAIEKYGTQEHVFTKTSFQKRYRQSFGKLIKL